MRTPSTPDQRWLWCERATAGKQVNHDENSPQCGFFKVRKFPYGQWPTGPYVPARVWIEDGQTDPETGDLLSDEIICMEIDGRKVDPWKRWNWIAKHPVSEAEWQWLRAMSPLLPDKIPSR